MLPYALGQSASFRDGEGPVLEPIADNIGVAQLEKAGAIGRLEPVFDAVRRVTAALGPETALIGFAGAPWTVATYMVEGGTSRDFRRVKAWAYRDPEGFAALIEILVETTIELLSAQISAGAEIVQLFDSWAGVLPEAAFARWVIAPTKGIVAALKSRHPGCPIIGFPRGAGLLYERYAAETGVDAVGLDTTVPTGVRLRTAASARDRARQSRSGSASDRWRCARTRRPQNAAGLCRRTLGVQSRSWGAAGNTD